MIVIGNSGVLRFLEASEQCPAHISDDLEAIRGCELPGSMSEQGEIVSFIHDADNEAWQLHRQEYASLPESPQSQQHASYSRC